jgi:leucyl-tRNA synthetase
LLSVFAPHIAEELWQITGNNGSIFSAGWPVYDEKYLAYDEVAIAVQVNGKLRSTIKMPVDSIEEEVKERVLANESLEKYMEGKEIKKVVYVKNRLINFVVG